MQSAKLDLFKLCKEEYVASREPQLVQTRTALYLAIEGSGEPGGKRFRERLEALYKVAYSVKVSSKAEGKDYVVSKLEALWWGSRGPGDFSQEPRDEWNWKLMIRTPDFVTQEDLKRGQSEVRRKVDLVEVGRVRLEKIDEGLCAQILHVGPYSEERATLEKMSAFVKDEGLSFHGLHHEIYLSDPRRVEPERLRTILRMPVC